MVANFSLRTTALHHIIKNNYRHTQQQRPTLQNHRVIAAHRRNCSLHDILVHSKFTANSRTQPTLHQNLYQNPHSKTGLPSLGTYSLTSQNIVYIITCTICNNHYVGETDNTILARLQKHLRNIREGRLSTHLVNHFQTHSTNNLIITGVENNDRWTNGQRKRAERIWIQGLGTIFPHNLNDHYWLYKTKILPAPGTPSPAAPVINPMVTNRRIVPINIFMTNIKEMLFLCAVVFCYSYTFLFHCLTNPSPCSSMYIFVYIIV